MAVLNARGVDEQGDMGVREHRQLVVGVAGVGGELLGLL